MKKPILTSVLTISVFFSGLISCDSDPKLDDFAVNKPQLNSNSVGLATEQDTYSLSDQLTFTPESKSQIESIHITSECSYLENHKKKVHKTSFHIDENIYLYNLVSHHDLYLAPNKFNCDFFITAQNSIGSTHAFKALHVNINNQQNKY